MSSLELKLVEVYNNKPELDSRVIFEVCSSVNYLSILFLL